MQCLCSGRLLSCIALHRLHNVPCIIDTCSNFKSVGAPRPTVSFEPACERTRRQIGESWACPGTPHFGRFISVICQHVQICSMPEGNLVYQAGNATPTWLTRQHTSQFDAYISRLRWDQGASIQNAVQNTNQWPLSAFFVSNTPKRWLNLSRFLLSLTHGQDPCADSPSGWQYFQFLHLTF